jgi:hypothetical protein
MTLTLRSWSIRLSRPRVSPSLNGPDCIPDNDIGDDGDDGAGRFNFYAPNPDHNRLSVAPTGGPNETGHEHEEDDVDNEIDRVEDSYGDADD